jgi:hypothetical protein
MGDPTSLKAEKDADQTARKTATAPLEVRPAQVRAPSIDGPVPAAALCEATASSARSPARLGVITASRGAFGPHWQPLRGPCWPPVLANGGRSALLAGARSTRSWSSSQAEPSERCAEQCQRAAPVRSRFSRPGRFNALRGQKPTQLRLSAHPTASTARSLVAPTLALTLAASYPRPPP